MYDKFLEVMEYIHFNDSSNDTSLIYRGEKIIIWPLIRYQLFWKLKKKYVGVEEIRQFHIPKLVIEGIMYEFLSIKNTKKVNLPMVLEWERDIGFANKFIDGETINIAYSDFYRDNVIVNSTKKFSSLTNTYFVKQQLLRRSDFVSICDNLNVDLYKRFDIQIGVRELAAEIIAYYYVNLKKFRIILKKYKPSCVYIISPPLKEYAITAAKEFGIKTIEIQHGTMDYFHPAYSYGCGFDTRYLIDELLIWDKYWLSTTTNDLFKVKVLPSGEKKTGITKPVISCDVLYISQYTINQKLYIDAVNFALEFPNKSIIFKVHPVSKFVDANSPPNLCIINKEYTLDDLLLSAKAVIGGYSTGLYEANKLGLKVYAIRSLCLFETYIADNNIIKINSGIEIGDL